MKKNFYFISNKYYTIKNDIVNIIIIIIITFMCLHIVGLNLCIHHIHIVISLNVISEGPSLIIVTYIHLLCI